MSEGLLGVSPLDTPRSRTKQETFRIPSVAQVHDLCDVTGLLLLLHMPGKLPGNSIKNRRVYEALRRKGYDKTTAARISNAMARGRRRRTAKTDLFAPLETADERLVYGVVSTPTPDAQGGVWQGERYDGDIVDPAALRAAIDDYLEWAAIREMHQPVAAGKALDVLVRDDVVYLVARIVDDNAWQKVKEGVYKGLSIGGRVIDAKLETLPDGRRVRRITRLQLTEISLVDRPANPEAAILLIKRGTMSEDETITLADLAQDGEAAVAKAADVNKIVQQIQALRNDAELAGDVAAAARYSEAILLLLGALEESDEEMPEMESEAGSENAVAAAATATLSKVGRKISTRRMEIIKRAWLDYGRVLAEAGDPDAQRFFAMLDDQQAVEQASKIIDAQLRKMLAPIAQALVSVNERVEKIAAQPASSPPLTRVAGANVAKRIAAPQPAPDESYLQELQRLALVETHPVRKQQYLQKLDELTKGV